MDCLECEYLREDEKGFECVAPSGKCPDCEYEPTDFERKSNV